MRLLLVFMDDAQCPLPHCSKFTPQSNVAILDAVSLLSHVHNRRASSPFAQYIQLYYYAGAESDTHSLKKLLRGRPATDHAKSEVRLLIHTAYGMSDELWRFIRDEVAAENKAYFSYDFNEGFRRLTELPVQPRDLRHVPRHIEAAFQVLNVPLADRHTAEKVHRHFRQMARQHHPDRHPHHARHVAHARMCELTGAYATLCDFFSQ